MDFSPSHGLKDKISELPDEILLEFLSLLDMKNAAQTSIISRRWRHLWTHLTRLDFDPKSMYPEEAITFRRYKYETRRYFAWINQVVSMHQGPSIDTFKVHSRYVSSYATQIDKWVKFAFSKRVKELVLDLIGSNLKYDVDYSRKGFPLGFDILKNPFCYSGITALQSLHLRYVDASEEFIEFLLSHCVHLERLYLHTVPLSNIKIKSSRIKYLSIITRLDDLEELEIDAKNLLYFEYEDIRDDGGPRMLFNCLPMLVETNFRGGFCRYPFPIFEKLEIFSMQLCKLSFDVDPADEDLVIPDGVIPTFPNVKHFTCSIECRDVLSIISMKRFIEACPMLEVFKLQVAYYFYGSGGSREASKLQDVDLEDEIQIVEPDINFSLERDEEHEDVVEKSHVENTNDLTESHLNLRVLELVGFLGTDCDIGFTLAVAAYACSLKTIICDVYGTGYTGHPDHWTPFENEEQDIATRRARKLAKIVPKVKVVIT